MNPHSQVEGPDLSDPDLQDASIRIAILDLHCCFAVGVSVCPYCKKKVRCCAYHVAVNTRAPHAEVGPLSLFYCLKLRDQWRCVSGEAVHTDPGCFEVDFMNCEFGTDNQFVFVGWS